jgi:hypothetical protein
MVLSLSPEGIGVTKEMQPEVSIELRVCFDSEANLGELLYLFLGRIATSSRHIPIISIETVHLTHLIYVPL